jgi:predicted transcriptional regulator
MTTMTVSIPETLLEKVDQEAQKEDRKRSQWVAHHLAKLVEGVLVELPPDVLARVAHAAEADHRTVESWVTVQLVEALSHTERRRQLLTTLSTARPC